MIIAITGASQGIGRAIAETFAQTYSGHAQIALLSRSKDKLQQVAESCQSSGAEASVFLCDVTDDEMIAHVARDIRATYGLPDVLVNNAGLFEPGSLQEITADAFRRQVAVNLTSAFVMTKAFLNDMIERGSGHLFYTASVASIKPYPGGAAYGASKHGLLGLARNVREETRESGLRVTSIIPGATYTPSWEASDLPESRFMKPNDVAKTVLTAYQLSDQAVMEEVLIRPQQGDI